MNLIELNRALRQLRLGGMAAVLETRLHQAQAEPMAPIDFLSCLVSDELTRRSGRLVVASDSEVGTFSFGYDLDGRLLSSSGPFGSVNYVRDAVGRVSHRQVAGQPGVDYAYDPVGNILSAAMPQASLGFAYDGRNELLTATRANGVTSGYTYDPVGRVLAVAHAHGTTTLASLGYSYDNAGNRISQQTSSAQALATQANTATYDDANRLIQRGSTGYSYDDNGNLTSENGSAGLITYTWDSRNRLKSIVAGNGQTTNFTYDFGGNLLVQSDSGPALNLTRTFVLDEITDVAYQQSSDGDQFSVLSGPWIDSHFATVRTGGQVEYGLTDVINSSITTVDQTGAVKGSFSYELFGETTASGSSYPFQYTGRSRLSNNLYYYRARFYSATTGRFVSEDPIHLAGGGVNFYSYAANSPVNWNDPSGLKVYICCRDVDLPDHPVMSCTAQALGLQHCFIETDTIEAGMGPANNGPLPACPIGVPTTINLHTGQAANSNCQEVLNVNEACVNGKLVPGRSTGRWMPWNNCNTFANNIIELCSSGSPAPASCNPNFQSCPIP